MPSVVLLAADDGVDPPDLARAGATTARGFSGPVEVRVIEGAGHDLPQERPSAVVDAVTTLLDV